MIKFYYKKKQSTFTYDRITDLVIHNYIVPRFAFLAGVVACLVVDVLKSPKYVLLISAEYVSCRVLEGNAVVEYSVVEIDAENSMSIVEGFVGVS